MFFYFSLQTFKFCLTVDVWVSDSMWSNQIRRRSLKISKSTSVHLKKKSVKFYFPFFKNQANDCMEIFFHHVLLGIHCMDMS